MCVAEGKAALLVRGFFPNWDFSRTTWDEVRSRGAAMEGRSSCAQKVAKAH